MPQPERRPYWSVVVPIQHLELDDALNYEFRIDRVTLVAGKKLAGRRRRFGFPSRISDLKAQPHGVFKRFFGQASVFAVLRVAGAPKEVQRQVVGLLRDELAILTASQLGYAKRPSVGTPAIWGERPVSRQSLLWISNQGAGWSQPNRVIGPILPLKLDAQWLQYQRRLFFLRLLSMLRSRRSIAAVWKRDLRRATVLIGLSQAASALPEAFLWNMIALELLLTRQGDTVGDALPSRAEAFLGWSSNWKGDEFETRIRRVYQRRCLFVHQGDRESPTREDLFFTDDLLLNVLTNIVMHPKGFSSKDAVVSFSERVQAERLLGIRPRVRPKSLMLLKRQYTPRDFDVY